MQTDGNCTKQLVNILPDRSVVRRGGDAMKYRKITAIFRSDAYKKVEQRLQELGVQGFSISHVKGYGEYADLYSSDWMTSHARLEIFTDEEKVETIVEAIMDSAHVGLAGDGIVAVLPVEKLYRIRTRSEIQPDES